MIVPALSALFSSSLSLGQYLIKLISDSSSLIRILFPYKALKSSVFESSPKAAFGFTTRSTVWIGNFHYSWIGTYRNGVI